MAAQEALKSFWLQAPDGRLCAREQAKAWALREVWRAEGNGDHGLYSWVASKVKNGGVHRLATQTEGIVYLCIYLITSSVCLESFWCTGSNSKRNSHLPESDKREFPLGIDIRVTEVVEKKEGAP